MRMLRFDVHTLQDLSWNQPQHWAFGLRLASLCLLGGISFIATWSLGSSRGDLQQATRQVAGLETFRVSVRSARAELLRLEEQLAELNAEMQRLKRGFLLADELPELLDLVSHLCNVRDVRIESLLIEPRQNRELLDIQPLRITFHGQYHQMGLVHQDIANLPWPVLGEDFEIRAGDENEEALHLGMTLLIPVEGTEPEVAVE